MLMVFWRRCASQTQTAHRSASQRNPLKRSLEVPHNTLNTPTKVYKTAKLHLLIRSLFHHWHKADMFLRLSAARCTSSSKSSWKDPIGSFRGCGPSAAPASEGHPCWSPGPVGRVLQHGAGRTAKNAHKGRTPSKAPAGMALSWVV